MTLGPPKMTIVIPSALCIRFVDHVISLGCRILQIVARAITFCPKFDFASPMRLFRCCLWKASVCFDTRIALPTLDQLVSLRFQNRQHTRIQELFHLFRREMVGGHLGREEGHPVQTHWVWRKHTGADIKSITDIYPASDGPDVYAAWTCVLPGDDGDVALSSVPDATQAATVPQGPRRNSRSLRLVPPPPAFSYFNHGKREK